ncbi:alpha/beta hydrolase [Ferrimonas balearica]|nr:alpha/beta hydrolase [Ferrimonas balearica]
MFLVVAALLLSTSVQAQGCVVLLHGLAKSDRDMTKLAKALEDAGYHPVNQDYASRSAPIEVLSAQVIDPALTRCGDHRPVHFVTHSMGGILVRHYLGERPLSGLGRVVMLGPPNQGSEAVDAYRNLPGFDLVGGTAGGQLGTDAQSLPLQLGAANFEVGIIAGSRSVNLILSTLLPGQDDGKVSVQSTELAGMRDHLILPVTHPFMMRNNEVIAQVLHFLAYGQFKRDQQGSAP